METMNLTSSVPSSETTDHTLAPLTEVMDLHKIRAALYTKIAATTDDSLMKTFFQRMATSSRRFRTELTLFSGKSSDMITEKVIKRIENIWSDAGQYLQQNNMAGLLQTWNLLEEVMIDAYLKVAANSGVRGNFRKVILKQIDSIRKDRNVYRFVESIFLQKMQPTA
ncbi:hypothetical protein QNI19_19805 [Cytophagaceae bacterium DM2B3-1]|uniref:DUF2383 domain-containing protein n=1 Tax=Xanthocytophaga flava TaxID=3048013 RepID=A0ABT7CN67_9BACT|nr:hypothetical protein [Xanthocytophaga flavus]MDJ1495195.1 hypothetical protein [Xanthocytophaga flavus]